MKDTFLKGIRASGIKKRELVLETRLTYGGRGLCELVLGPACLPSSLVWADCGCKTSVCPPGSAAALDMVGLLRVTARVRGRQTPPAVFVP